MIEIKRIGWNLHLINSQRYISTRRKKNMKHEVVHEIFINSILAVIYFN